jgi:hypothetical protein
MEDYHPVPLSPDEIYDKLHSRLYKMYIKLDDDVKIDYKNIIRVKFKELEKNIKNKMNDSLQKYIHAKIDEIKIDIKNDIDINPNPKNLEYTTFIKSKIFEENDSEEKKKDKALNYYLTYSKFEEKLTDTINNEITYLNKKIEQKKIIQDKQQILEENYKRDNIWEYKDIIKDTLVNIAFFHLINTKNG